MKFTKQQAYENIVAKLTPNGETLSLSERSINDQLETLIPLLANEETELDAFVKSCFPIFKTANANVNNDVSKGIKKYKDEHPDDKPKPNGDKDGQQQQQVSPDLLKRLEEMEAWKASQDKDAKVGELKKKVLSELKSKGVKDEGWIESALSMVSIDENSETDKVRDSLLELYNKSVAAVNHNAVPLGGTNGGDNQKGIDKTIAAAAEYAKNTMLN